MVYSPLAGVVFYEFPHAADSDVSTRVGAGEERSGVGTLASPLVEHSTRAWVTQASLREQGGSIRDTSQITDSCKLLPLPAARRDNAD